MHDLVDVNDVLREGSLEKPYECKGLPRDSAHLESYFQSSVFW